MSPLLIPLGQWKCCLTPGWQLVEGRLLLKPMRLSAQPSGMAASELCRPQMLPAHFPGNQGADSEQQNAVLLVRKESHGQEQREGLGEGRRVCNLRTWKAERQENYCTFEANLGYTASPNLRWEGRENRCLGWEGWCSGTGWPHWLEPRGLSCLL